MGLGKSLVALHSMAGLNKCLIVCPAFLKPNWQNEISKWTAGGEFLISSYESLKKVDFNFDGCILDEVHYIKNKDSQRTQEVFSIIERVKPQKLIGLTGTPIKNKVIDFWTILYLILGDKLSYNYWAFCNRFSNKITKTFGGKSITSFEGINLKNAQELSNIVKSCSIRKKSSDVLDLPEQVYNYVNIDDEFDEKLKVEFEKYLAENSISKNMASFKVANALAKTKYSIKIISELLDQDKSVVCFTDHVTSCELIAKEFNVAPITGLMSSRQELVDAFNKGTTKLIVATIKSLNVGVNLTSAQYMIFNDFSYSPSDNDQAEKRIHRIGQKQTCFYTYIFASKLDAHIFKILSAKREVIKAVV